MINLIPITTDKELMNKYLINHFFVEIYNVYEKLYPRTGYHLPWVGYFALFENEVVGVGGYKGSPKNNKIEIAYGVTPEKEGHGFATEICKELINVALTEDQNLRVTARTLMQENASTTILRKNGFTLNGIVEDPEDGEVWEWELNSE